MKSKTSCLPQNTVYLVTRRKHHEKKSLDGWFYGNRLLFLFGSIFCLRFLPAKYVVESRGTAGSWGWWWWSEGGGGGVGVGVYLLCPPSSPNSPLPASILQSMWNESQTKPKFKAWKTSGCWRRRDGRSEVTAALRRVCRCVLAQHGWRNPLGQERLSRQSRLLCGLTACWTNARPTTRALSSLSFFSSCALCCVCAARTRTHNTALIIGAQQPKSPSTARSKYAPLKLASSVGVSMLLLFTSESKMQSYKWQINRKLCVRPLSNDRPLK